MPTTVEIDPKAIGIWLAAIAPVCGFFVWAVAKLLDSRKEKLAMGYEIERLNNKLKELEYLEKYVNKHEKEIGILIEKTKKL